MFHKISISFLLIIATALLFRTIFLDRIPTGISNDEMDYLLNAKSVYLSGSDISHTWNPLTFTTPKSSGPQAEIAPLITFWAIGPLSFSLFSSKFIYALFSVGIVILIYLLTKKLIGDKEAFAVGLVAACNPWLIFFGRSAYDASLAIFFFLLSFYILLVSRKWYILLSFPALFIAFYAYIGTKLILIPFALIILAFAWFCNNSYKKQYITILLLCIALFAYYVFSILHTPGARLNELATPNMDNIAFIVNSERRTSIHSPLTTIFSNKYVEFGKYAIDKYVNAFSPEFLFISGDSKAQFTLWDHGVFYYADAFFLLIGFGVLFSINRKVLSVLSAIALAAPIPSVLSTVGNSYAIRSMLLAPVFVIFIGIGILYTIRRFKFAWIPIGIIYLVLILNFVNIYFLRNPTANSESFNFSARELAKYLSFQTGSVFVINGDPTTPYKQFLFYNNGLTRQTAQKVASDFKNKTFSINTIHFIKCEEANKITSGSVIIYDNCKNVFSSKEDLFIAQLEDGGAILRISNDKICSKYNLNRYPYGITFSDLDVERLSISQFCTKFITRQ